MSKSFNLFAMSLILNSLKDKIKLSGVYSLPEGVNASFRIDEPEFEGGLPDQKYEIIIRKVGNEK